jgi:hypothetical protein
LYSSIRSTPSSFARAVTFPQSFSRSNALARKSFGYFFLGRCFRVTSQFLSAEV